MSKQKTKDNRWVIRNRKIRAENDFNQVMSLYVTHKYGPIAMEVCNFYDKLRSKYPQRRFYKGSQRFQTWLKKQITTYCEEHASCDDEQASETDPAADEQASETGPVADEQASETGPVAGQQVQETEPVADEQASETGPVAGQQVQETEPVADEQVPETDPVVEDVLSLAMREFGEMQPVAHHVTIPSNSTREEQQLQELNDLDSVLAQMIADLESEQDEGVVMDPVLGEIEEELNSPLVYDDTMVEWW